MFMKGRVSAFLQVHDEDAFVGSVIDGSGRMAFTCCVAHVSGHHVTMVNRNTSQVSKNGRAGAIVTVQSMSSRQRRYSGR